MKDLKWNYQTPKKQIAQRKGAETITAPFLLLFITQAQQQKQHKRQKERQTKTAKPNTNGKIKEIRQEKGKTARNKPNGKKLKKYGRKQDKRQNMATFYLLALSLKNPPHPDKQQTEQHYMTLLFLIV